MEGVGQVHDVIKEFEWRINDFFSLPLEDRKCCKSPLFSFVNESWCLAIYPNGHSDDNSLEHVSLYLLRAVSGPPICLSFSFSLKTSKGKKDNELQCDYVFEKQRGYGSTMFLKRSTLLEKKAELAPSDTLTILCTLKYCSKSTNDAGNTRKCSHCRRTFDAESVSSHEEKCLDKPIRCPTCNAVVNLRMWFDHECEMARVKATEKLIDDLEDICNCEEHSDVTIKVKDKEFRLHRNILAGRSPYFKSMFKTEMKEKTTGIVTIDDCKPDVFHSFVLFIYTGNVDEMSLENVCDLYKVADKYQEDQLKEECLDFMKTEMSVESFCDFIILALKHDEKELLQNATDFFCRKTKEIIESVKWQNFMGEYRTQANELYIKAFDYNVK